MQENTIAFDDLKLYRVTNLRAANGENAPAQLIYAPSMSAAKLMAADRLDGTWSDDTEADRVEEASPVRFVVPEQWIFKTNDYHPPEQVPVVAECWVDDRWRWKVCYRDGGRYWALNAGPHYPVVRRWYPIPAMEVTP